MVNASAGTAITGEEAQEKSNRALLLTSSRLSVRVGGFILLLVLLYAMSLYSYLLFHTVAELASIVVAVVIFVVTWYTKRYINNNYLVFIGIAYLFIAAIDLVHLLAYTGMNLFAGFDTNLPTQLWIAARTLQALSLLAAPFMLHRKMNERVVFAGYLVIFILLMLSIFSWQIFPASFIMGQGQTPFKIGMEYLISGILVLSAFLLYRNRDAFDPQVMMLLYLSIAATILSELAFTTYFNTYGFTNFLGHILKILAFLCIYLAVIDTGFSRPFALIFRDLSQSREELRDLNSRLESKVEERTMELRQSNENLRASCEQLSAAEEKLRVQNSELSRRDDAVQAINRDLEKRVEERTSELQHVNEELRNSQEGLHRQIDALAARDRLLAESEERFRISAYSVSDVIWDWKIPPGTLDWYGDIDEMLGYAPGEFPRTPVAWENIIHPDDQLRVMEILHRHVTAGTPYATEYRVVRKDGAIRTWTDRGNVMRDMDGTAYRMVGSCNDITDYRMAEETLRASEVRYRRLFEAAQDGILILDAVTGQIVDVNPFLISMLGFSHEQFQGKKIWDIGVFKDLIANKDNFEELQRKEYIRYENLPLETADGRNIAVEFVSNVYRVNDRKVIQCNIRDITERRKLADQIEASLAEKETLLKEIHHRVKNNLQIITSMLNLQIRKINDPATIETLKDSQSRVRSMALVHEHLYRSEDLSRIDLRNYIRALGTGLFQSYEAANRGIRLDLNVQDVHVDINTAIPLGLISNELITNALKYAFEGKKDGRISIYAADESGGLRFVVADNGTGMPETVTFENQASLGLRLVSLLTEQLKGTVAIDRMDGTTFTIQIPRDAGPDKPGVNP